MAAEKAQALVIRTVEFSETSSIVTVFSREFGKLSGLAKGARRPKGPFDAGLDLLGTHRLVFLWKPADTLHLFTEAKLETRFRPREGGLGALYAGYYLAELLSELTFDHDPHPNLFDAARDLLDKLMHGRRLAAAVLAFERTLLEELGLWPKLDACIGCGKVPPATGPLPISFADGGCVCRDCRHTGARVMVLTAESRQALVSLWSQGVDLSQASVGELRGLFNHLIAAAMDRRPRLQPYIVQLRDDAA